MNKNLISMAGNDEEETRREEQQDLFDELSREQLEAEKALADQEQLTKVKPQGEGDD